jgi:hypothetical protein
MGEMLVAGVGVLRIFAWTILVEGISWGTIAADALSLNIQIQGETVRRVSRAVGFKALGCWIIYDATDEAEVLRRISKGWQAFYKHQDLRRRLLNIVGYSTLSVTQHRRLLNIINLVHNRNKETN